MAAPKGNRFWEARTTHGAPHKYDAMTLWKACVEYFHWVEDNPLKEEKVFHNQGNVTRATVSKMRAMTMDGLYTFLDISPQSWKNWRTTEGLMETVQRVERIIRDQKFSGAAADLLNSNIIARDLGLTERIEAKQDVTTKRDQMETDQLERLLSVTMEELNKARTLQ